MKTPKPATKSASERGRAVISDAFITTHTGKRVPMLLVDAAPELLVAAKAAAKAWSIHYPDTGLIGTIIGDLKAAIAKAEGRE